MNFFEENRKQIMDAWFDLLRFPSIGSDPLHLRDCVACAMWTRKWLAGLGFRGELLSPPGHLGSPPILLAERRGSEGAPTVLFYGHYDVQPPDPIDAWTTNPFEPVEKEGRVFARGAQDDKGQWFAFLNGLKSLLAESGTRVPTVKVLLEGQEESGSTSLTALAPSLADRIRADVLLVCDTSAAADLRPAVVAGLRGVSHFMIRLEGPSYDLHSGEHGGIAPNPARGIAELVASLHHPDGSIAVRGFCDHVTPPTDAERTAAESAAMSPETYEATFGCPPDGGETGLTLTERNSFRPTIEVNGIHSGYAGTGSKTIIPATAFAKISMRLVPDQNPDAALACVERHLRQRVPHGLRLFIEEKTGGAAGFRLPLSSPVFRLAAHVLEQMDPRGAVFQWDGASIPVVSTLRTCSGAAPLIVGFGQPEDRIHAPNESYGINQFRLAMTWARGILSALAE